MPENERTIALAVSLSLLLLGGVWVRDVWVTKEVRRQLERLEKERELDQREREAAATNATPPLPHR